ncbi:hypothetical protein AB0K43_15590 [Kitasatospora sp. NPDC049258]|uniref:hypothetical protein n=1 Tax=Kitasatospora sp. NPDC049258 TaxID=3155394 RepID=UPI003417E0CC
MPRDETSGRRTAQLRLGRLPGYVRRPDLARRNSEDGRAYKKGWEVRFTARTEEEIAEIRELVIAAGFAPARPFFKGHQLIQPVYGIAAVQAYLAAREAVEAAEESARSRRTEPSLGIPGQTRREAAPAAASAAAVAASAAAASARRSHLAEQAAPQAAPRPGGGRSDVSPVGRTS